MITSLSPVTNAVPFLNQQFNQNSAHSLLVFDFVVSHFSNENVMFT